MTQNTIYECAHIKGSRVRHQIIIICFSFSPNIPLPIYIRSLSASKRVQTNAKHFRTTLRTGPRREHLNVNHASNKYCKPSARAQHILRIQSCANPHVNGTHECGLLVCAQISAQKGLHQTFACDDDGDDDDDCG